MFVQLFPHRPCFVLCVTASFVYHHIVCQIVIFLSCLTLFHFVCFISPNFSFPPFFCTIKMMPILRWLWFPPLSHCLTLSLSLPPSLFGCYHLSFSSMPSCSFYTPPPSPFYWNLSLPSCTPVLSPQICIRVSSQGLRLLCLLTCSSLSQVKSDPPSTLKACSIYSLPCPPFSFQVSGVLCLWLSFSIWSPLHFLLVCSWPHAFSCNHFYLSSNFCGMCLSMLFSNLTRTVLFLSRCQSKPGRRC